MSRRAVSLCPVAGHGVDAPLFAVWAAQSEAEFQAVVVAMAKVRGWMHYHTHDSRRSPGGFPDLVLVRRGRLVFAELKRMHEDLRRDQLPWAYALVEAARMNGKVEAFIWRPCDMDEIEEVLR